MIISSLLFTVINPIMLLRRAQKQVKRNPGFSTPIEYTFTKKGFTMQQGEEKATAEWKDLWKVRDGKKYLYLYRNLYLILIIKNVTEWRPTMKKILLTGGGTAGHVTPNIALFPKLKEMGYDIHYIGSYDGI